jgi:hypothetical protein
MHRYVNLVVEAASVISRRLGYRPDAMTRSRRR